MKFYMQLFLGKVLFEFFFVLLVNYLYTKFVLRQAI